MTQDDMTQDEERIAYERWLIEQAIKAYNRGLYERAKILINAAIRMTKR